MKGIWVRAFLPDWALMLRTAKLLRTTRQAVHLEAEQNIVPVLNES